MAMFYAFLIFSVFGSALTQVPSSNPCPAIQSMHNFNATKFLGRWYEAQRTYHNFEFHTRCNRIDYIPGDNGTVTVINSFINPITGAPGHVQADIITPNSDRPGEMIIHMPLTADGIDSNYWILDTDNDTYVIIFGCTDFPNLSLTYMWMLTRQQVPDDETLAALNDILTDQLLAGNPLLPIFNVQQRFCNF